MPTQLPRISAYVSKEAHARFLALAKTHGLTPRQLLEGLIDGAFQDKRDWMAQQSGHQTMLTLALVTALAKRTLKDDEIAKVRHMGGQAGALLFGPLGKRPFTVEAPVPDDDRLLALFAALSE
jgi:hypothetical protein